MAADLNNYNFFFLLYAYLQVVKFPGCSIQV